MNIIDHIKLPFRKDKELYLQLYRILGILPHNISLYKLALMHKSVAHRTAKGRPANNERLEFLGDAVLDATVGHIVYDHFPGKREGFLTNTRSKLVQRETLGRLAKEMGITQLILSSGRSATHNSYMGGNAFEALVGALYLDHGYDACMKFVQKQILSKLVNIDKVAYKEVNFKSKLIEWTQKNRVVMEFRCVEETKDENGSPVFEYVCMLEHRGLQGQRILKERSATARGGGHAEETAQAAKVLRQHLPGKDKPHEDGRGAYRHCPGCGERCQRPAEFHHLRQQRDNSRIFRDNKPPALHTVRTARQRAKGNAAYRRS